MSSLWLTETLGVPIIASIVGVLASQIASYASNERLTKKLEWTVLALSKDANSKHAEILQSVVNEVEARLLASHFAPRKSFFATIFIVPTVGLLMGIPSDEPLMVQNAQRAFFLFYCAWFTFSGHKALMKHKALKLYFLSSPSKYATELPIADNDYSNHLTIKGAISLLFGSTGLALLLAYFSYSVDTGMLPSTSWASTMGFLIAFFTTCLAFPYLPLENQKISRSWSSTLIERAKRQKMVNDNNNPA